MNSLHALHSGNAQCASARLLMRSRWLTAITPLQFTFFNYCITGTRMLLLVVLVLFSISISFLFVQQASLCSTNFIYFTSSTMRSGKRRRRACFRGAAAGATITVALPTGGQLRATCYRWQLPVQLPHPEALLVCYWRQVSANLSKFSLASGCQ